MRSPYQPLLSGCREIPTHHLSCLTLLETKNFLFAICAFRHFRGTIKTYACMYVFYETFVDTCIENMKLIRRNEPTLLLYAVDNLPI